MMLKAFLVWLVIAVAEVLHGMLCVRLLNRRVGDRAARQIALFTGSGIMLIIAWLTIRGLALPLSNVAWPSVSCGWPSC